jgi:hypothetical protein
MRFVFGKRLVLAAISLAFVLTCAGSAQARSGAATVAKVKDTLPHWYLTRFAGLFPPVEARPTLPAHGKFLFELPGGSLYADGHIITDRGVRRLTPWGARLLWSKVRTIGLAARLFRHRGEGEVEVNREAAVANHAVLGSYKVCSGRDVLYAYVGTTRRAGNALAPARVHALARIETLFANATSRLPARAWADRTIRPYVPSGYDLSFDRMAPDPAKLPSPARHELAQYQPLLHHYSQGVTTDQARALIAAFVKAGVKPVRNPGWGPGALSFRLPVAHVYGSARTAPSS